MIRALILAIAGLSLLVFANYRFWQAAHRSQPACVKQPARQAAQPSC